MGFFFRRSRQLNKDGVDSIRTGLDELKEACYLKYKRKRNEKGHLKNSEYIVYEQPILNNPISEEPTLENPTLANPTQENPA